MADTPADLEQQDTSSDSGMGVATDFPKVEPLSAQEDPAKENFLPNPAERESGGEEQEPV